MLLVESKPQVEEFGQLSEGMFGIAEKDQAHILGILRSRLYSDKILAVIREYSTNALDAHIDIGVPGLPVKVGLPTVISPNFTVRDFGPGLTEKQIYEVYVKYGASTKRSSNDSIGQFGIGAKSAFCYSNSFTVTSFVDGRVSIYHAYIDETNIGKVSKLSDEETDQPNGVEISVPVKRQDFDTFRTKAIKLFRHFDVKPEVNCDLPEEKVFDEGTNWRLLQKGSREQAYAVMGNVGYPIDIEKVADALNLEDPNNKEFVDLVKSLLSSSIEIRFPIGSLFISASRESLEYTDLTTETLKRAVSKILKILVAKVEKNFEECKTVWEARNLYDDYRRSSDQENYFLRSISQKKFHSWKGQDIDHPTFNYLTVSFVLPNVSGQGKDKPTIRPRYIPCGMDQPKRAVLYHSNTISYNSSLALVIIDVKGAWISKCLSLRKYIQEKEGWDAEILALQVDNQATSQDFEAGVAEYIKLHGLAGITTYRLSDLPPDMKVVKRAPSQVSPKILGAAFKLIKNDLSIRGTGRYSQCWDRVEVDLANGSGIYVPINHFIPTTGKDRFLSLMRAFRALDAPGAQATEIFGFRPKIIWKLGPGWVSLQDILTQKVKQKSQDKDTIESLCNFKEFSELNGKLIDSNFDGILKKRADIKDANSLFLEFMDNYRKFQGQRSNISSLSFLSDLFKEHNINFAHQPAYPLGDAYKKVISKYPMLVVSQFFSSQFSSWSKNRGEWESLIIDYINQLD